MNKQFKYVEYDGNYFRIDPKFPSGVSDILRDGKWIPYTGSSAHVMHGGQTIDESEIEGLKKAAA